MALTIVNEQYPPRKPKLTLTADSLDELPTEGVAEGSTATVGGTEYSYDSNAGWIVPGSGGGGSGGGAFWVTFTKNQDTGTFSADKTLKEIYDAAQTQCVLGRYGNQYALYILRLQLCSYYEQSGQSYGIARFSATEYQSDGSDNGWAGAMSIDVKTDGSVTVGEWTWTVEDDS